MLRIVWGYPHLILIYGDPEVYVMRQLVSPLVWAVDARTGVRQRPPPFGYGSQCTKHIVVHEQVNKKTSMWNLPSYSPVTFHHFQDPLSKERNGKELLRLSIVRGEDGEKMMDTLVRPSNPVVDWRTDIHGVGPEHLEGVMFTQRWVMKRVKGLGVGEDGGRALSGSSRSLFFFLFFFVSTFGEDDE